MLKRLLALLFLPCSFAFAEVRTVLPEIKAALSEQENAAFEAQTFKLIFDLESANEQDLKLIDVLRDHAIFKKISLFSSLNLNLKSDVLYTFYQGTEPFFGASQNQILIPYTFLYQVYDLVRTKYPQQDELSNTIFAFTIEKLLWLEFGRVLVDQYSLSIIGEEEISLDQFSTLMLINLSELDSEYLLDATEAFLKVNDTTTLFSRISFKSETEMDDVRYRLVMCMVLGKDHEKQIEQLDELTWDQDRLSQCKGHYQDKMISWYDALKPFLKPKNSLKKWSVFLLETEHKAEIIRDISAESHEKEVYRVELLVEEE
jgi:hypothetical protein